jgi:hypothetical protein
MKSLRSAVWFLFLLLAAIPAFAADPIYGVWQQRKDKDKNSGVTRQVVTVEASGGAVKFSYDIDLGQTHLQYSFVTNMDGKPVPAMSNGHEIMKVWVKKISPYEYQSGSSAQGAETQFKGVISSDGKVWTTDGTIKSGNGTIPSHVVFDKIK